ncbi:hypothetical protein H7Y29_00175 [Microbacteriaceae bacterium]|nr:hypothetical protein [Candidatus Saccharibacteria bacterium]
MRNMRRIVRFQAAGMALTALLLTAAVAGCAGGSDVPKAQRPAAVSQPTLAHVPSTASVVSKTTSPVVVHACGNNVAPKVLVRVDGQLKCLKRDELQAYDSILRERARALLEPIGRSVSAGASPEAALRSLVALSCKQSLDNPIYWVEARYLYLSIIKQANPDALVTKRSGDFSVALRRGCY